MKLRDENTDKKVLIFVSYLFLAVAITFIGVMLVAANMSNDLYVNKVYQFSGIKIALVIPLLVLAVMVVIDGVSRAGESYRDFCRRIYTNAVLFLEKPIYIWGVLLALIFLIGISLMLLRSGNDSGMGVSDLELRFRSVLEQVMSARPRTKEFLVGFPSLLLAFVAAKKGFTAASQWLIIVGGVGIVDFLNTFCHAHTPFMVSIVRSVNSLVIGVIIALTIYGIWQLIENKQRLNAKEIK